MGRARSPEKASRIPKVNIIRSYRQHTRGILHASCPDLCSCRWRKRRLGERSPAPFDIALNVVEV